jgi:LacI family transcriptional regulator
MSVVTQKQIAERLGISRQLVGFALNGGGTVSARMRRQIQDAAREMGYRPNEIARTMATGRSRVLGFLVPNPELENVARMLTGALEEAEATDYFVKVLRLRSETDMREVIERCAALRLAGVMVGLLPHDRLNRLFAEFDRFGIPVALMDCGHTLPLVPCILSNDLQGCRAALDHLISLGHRRIGFLAGPRGEGSADMREQGYRETMAARGLPVREEDIARGHWGRAPQTDDAALALLNRPAPERPTAVFCVDDKSALVALRIARSLLLFVPGDVSIVGFANLTMAEYSDPPLTTVAQPFSEMGRVAVRRLLTTVAARDADETDSGESEEEKENRGIEPSRELLPTRLIVRGSTAPPRI